MGIVFRLVGLPFAVIGGTIDIAHEGIGIAADSVAKKRRQRNDSNRPTRQYPSSGQCPNCTNCKSAISLKASNYHRTGPIQSSECPTEVSAQSQSENCRVYPAYAPLRRGPRTELPIHEPNLHSAELSACETSPPELDSHGPTSLPVELLSQRYSARAEPGGMYVFQNLLLRTRR